MLQSMFENTNPAPNIKKHNLINNWLDDIGKYEMLARCFDFKTSFLYSIFSTTF